MIQIEPIYHEIQLNFGNSEIKRTVIKQNSTDTHVLNIYLYDNDRVLNISSSWDIYISCAKSDNTYILNSQNISCSGNKISVPVTQQMVTSAGTVKCELIIKNGTRALFSDTFFIYVEPNVQDGSFIESTDEYNSIIQSLDKVKGYEQEALNVKDHIVSVSNEVDILKENIEETYEELEDAVAQTKDLIAENEIIKQNEADRINAENLRASNETARQQAETERIANEEERINKEQTRQSNEDARIQAENARSEAEINRDDAESLRKSQEEARVISENERISNEEKRIQSESIRNENENNRIANEEKRVNAETDREANETERQNTELARDTEENKRNSNEQIRQSNENVRIQAETDRINEETKRQEAELLRASQEETRIESENIRSDNENARNQAESTRVNNEEIRIANENARIVAESARATEFDEIKNNAETEITKLQNVNVEAIEGQESYQVKVTDKDGNSKTSDNLLNKISIGTVDKGDYNESPSATITGEFGNQKLNLRLPTGNPFVISNTYSSISEMEADKENINLYDFVMINTGNVEDEDNGKLYMKDSNGMMFITDLSGVQGIQGVKGETGLTPNLTIGSVTTGEPGTDVSVTITGTKENPVINFTIPRGDTGSIDNVSATTVPYDDESSVKDILDKLQSDMDEKSDTNHTHDDRYYTESEIDEKLDTKSDSDHLHDDRYYTESEIDEKLADKSDSNHIHDVYENQNAFSNITVDSTTISADTSTDTISIVGGDNVTIAPDAVNNKITISAVDTKYVHPTTSGNKHIPSGGSDGQILKWSADGTAIWGKQAGGSYVGASAPSDTSILWVDTANGGIMKYYNGSAWTAIASTWG